MEKTFIAYGPFFPEAGRRQVLGYFKGEHVHVLTYVQTLDGWKAAGYSGTDQGTLEEIELKEIGPNSTRERLELLQQRETLAKQLAEINKKL